MKKKVTCVRCSVDCTGMYCLLEVIFHLPKPQKFTWNLCPDCTEDCLKDVMESTGD